ncbi:AraC family transcriptional regulator [soil metagenome]
MDPLSDVFSLLRVERLVAAHIEVRGAWAMRFTGLRHIKFAGVLEGAFWLWVEDGTPPLRLETGDFYLLTRGQTYCTGSDPRLEAVDGRAVLSARVGTDGIVRYGDEGERTSASGGRFVFDNDASGLLSRLLPPIVHVPAASESAASLRAVLELLRLESRAEKPGAPVAAAGLANIVLVQILRAHMAAGAPTPGWLGALADPKIGAALALMHTDIARPWRVDDLASAVAMSRTAFAERFKSLVGIPPLTYLTDWRMAVAGFALKTSGKSVAAVAESVGYGSDVAFSTAFRRATGSSPGRLKSKRAVATEPTRSD